MQESIYLPLIYTYLSSYWIGLPTTDRRHSSLIEPDFIVSFVDCIRISSELALSMAQSDIPSFNHFLVSFPHEFVAHVEINRPDKLNAFFEEYKQSEVRSRYLAENI